MRLLLAFLILLPISAKAPVTVVRPAFRTIAAAGGGSACDSLNSASLKYYYRMDEFSDGTSTVTREDTKGSNDLTDNNTVTSDTGKISDAAQFVQANLESLSITDNADVSCVGDMTISFWVRINTGGTSGIYTLFGKNLEFYLYRNTTGTLAGYVDDSVLGFPNGSSLTTTDTIPEDGTTWNHVVFQYRTSTKKLRIKINDGTWAESAIAVTNNATDSTGIFQIGFDGPLGTGYLQGLVDEFAKWDAVLSDADITTLYGSGGAACRPSGL